MFGLFGKDRRKSYRVVPESVSQIGISMILPNRKLKAKKILNLSMEGASCSFPTKECPRFTLNEKIRLKLELGSPKKVIQIDAFLRGSDTVSDTTQCRFQFADPSSLLLNLTPSLWKCFNRRQAFRVNLDPISSPEVTLEWRDGVTRGHLADISAKGMGLSVRPDVAQELGHPDRLMLSFRLPGCDIPLKIVGQSFYRRSEKDDFIRYGIQFDWSRTENAQQQEAALVDYVMRRQQEIYKERQRNSPDPK
jgi:hypothetical protein